MAVTKVAQHIEVVEDGWLISTDTERVRRDQIYKPTAWASLIKEKVKLNHTYKGGDIVWLLSNHHRVILGLAMVHADNGESVAILPFGGSLIVDVGKDSLVP